MRDVLEPGGRVVLIVPALQALYGSIDRAIHHYRRYSRGPRSPASCERAGLAVEHVSYFNMLGVPGWFLNSRVLKRQQRARGSRRASTTGSCRGCASSAASGRRSACRCWRLPAHADASRRGSAAAAPGGRRGSREIASAGRPSLEGRMSRLWRYVACYRARLLWGIVCLIAATSLVMTVPWLVKTVVDAHRRGAGRARDLARPSPRSSCIAVVLAVVRTASRALIFNVGRDVEYDLRNDLFAHLEHLPLSLLPGVADRRSDVAPGERRRRRPHAARARASSTSSTRPSTTSTGSPSCCRSIVSLTLAALAVYPLALLFVKRSSRLLMERTLQRAGGPGRALQPRAAEPVRHPRGEGVRVPRTHELRRSRALNARFQEANLRLARVRGFIGPVMNVVGGVGCAGRPLARRTARRHGAIVRGRSRRVHRLPRPARVADHGPRLDAVGAAARAGGAASA